MCGFFNEPRTIRKKLIVLPLLSLGLFLIACSGNPALPQVTTQVDISEYPWINPSYNILQFYTRDALKHFHEKWQKTDKEKLSIVHLGDSHLQPGVLTEQIRKQLQEKHGDAGLGLIFPSKLAKTYPSFLYKTPFTGVWEWTRSLQIRHKVPLGVRGMSCRTRNPYASFAFEFENEIPEHYTFLKIYCKQAKSSYDLVLKIGENKIPVEVDSASSILPYIGVYIAPLKDKKITFQLMKSHPYETEFEFYGASLESTSEQGLIMHNAGVGGARFQSILYQKLFREQLPTLDPDVVILDFGTNDYLYEDKIKPELEGEIKKIIGQIREVAPEVSIILPTAQDLYWKGRNIRSGKAFAQLIHKIAQETNCAVYDWYNVAGGQRVMSKWVNAKLAQKDFIHLYWKGSRLKGDLFYEAIENVINRLDDNPSLNELIIPVEKPVAGTQAKVSDANPSLGAVKNDKPATSQEITHTISAGETLHAIASKYNVTVKQIMEWNNLENSNIFSGNTLIIHKSQ